MGGSVVTTYSETLRQVVHVAMVGFAFLLRYLTWPQAALLALAALVFNAIVLARVSPGIMRPTDAGGHRAGVVFYPLSVLTLILVFRERLDIAAAAWATMAVGDGAATLVGTHVGGRRLPWNPEKTWSGLVAFAVAGSIGAVALSAWVAPAVSPTPPYLFTWFAPVVAAVVAAFVETIPINLDDNLSVPFAAGLTLAIGAAVEPAALQEELVHSTHRYGWAVIASAGIALVALKARSWSPAGASAGTVIGVAIFAFGGFQAWTMLLAAYTAAVTSLRAGRKQLSRQGKEEERGARSGGAGHVIASSLVGAIGAWLMAAIDADATGALVLTAGLVAGGSHTVATELRNGYGRPAGLLAGLVAATTMGTLFALMFPPFRLLAPFVVVGAAFGSVTQRALASRYHAKGVFNDDVLLFLNTFVAAAVACAGGLIVVALRNRMP